MSNYEINVESLGSVTRTDLVRVLLGDKIGEGMSRAVYSMAFNPDLVVKLEDKSESFQNIQEWEVWKWAQDSKWARWFAPCEAISPCGCVLVQRRASIFTASDRLPTELPSLFSDLKPGNFGRIGGKVVAVDYALSYLQRAGLRSTRMKAVRLKDWHK